MKNIYSAWKVVTDQLRRQELEKSDGSYFPSRGWHSHQKSIFIIIVSYEQFAKKLGNWILPKVFLQKSLSATSITYRFWWTTFTINLPKAK